MTNVAIFGGSFDPPHLGHVKNVIDLLNNPEIDSIEILICFQQTGKNLSLFRHRAEMCYRTFSCFPRLSLNYLEQTLGGESSSIRSLEALAKKNPTWKMRFVIGADLVPTFDSWEGSEKIKELAPLIVMPRENSFSSSRLRDALRSQDWERLEKSMMPRPIAYLHDNPKLYGDSIPLTKESEIKNDLALDL